MMNPKHNSVPDQELIEGILLVDKPPNITSFHLVRILRKRLGIKKIGHAGTLDPFATGVMVMLIGRRYTRLSDHYLCNDKEYTAKIRLGITTNTYDLEGQMIAQSSQIPTLDEIQMVLSTFQGSVEQIPPMYSAKKIQGKKLYELARKGQEVARDPVIVSLETTFISYRYPFLELHIRCSKGTYIRSLAYDIGQKLGCGAHLEQLRRTRSGKFSIDNCINEDQLHSLSFNLIDQLLRE